MQRKHLVTGLGAVVLAVSSPFAAIADSASCAGGVCIEISNPLVSLGKSAEEESDTPSVTAQATPTPEEEAGKPSSGGGAGAGALGALGALGGLSGLLGQGRTSERIRESEQRNNKNFDPYSSTGHLAAPRRLAPQQEKDEMDDRRF